MTERDDEKRRQMIENLKKAQTAPKGQKCPVSGCDGRMRSVGGTRNNRFLSDTGQGYVYLPGECKIRKRKCNKCGYTFRTVEIPTKKYEKDLILIRKLKVALKEYIA